VDFADIGSIIAVLPKNTRTSILELQRVGKLIETKEGVKRYVFDKDRVEGTGEIIENYIQLDRDVLKYLLLRISNKPEYFEKNGIEKYLFDEITPYINLITFDNRASLVVYNESKEIDYIMTTLSSHSDKRVSNFVYCKIKKGSDLIETFIIFEHNLYLKTLTPVKFYTEGKIQETNLAKFNFSNVVADIDKQGVVSVDTDYLLSKMLTNFIFVLNSITE
jgi:hypothetical protein